LTDSNGRGIIQRTRNFRETWDLDITTEPISANYYPLNSRIGIRDDDNDLWVMTDRSEGATSMKSGEIEIMVHRRLLRDDSFGVGEALDEQAFGEGLVVRGKHRVLLCAAGNNCLLESALIAENLFAEPVLQFGEACFEQLFEDRGSRKMKSIELPKSIKLLSMEKFAPSQILVRLENLDLSGERETINLEDLFPEMTIKSIEERTLDGNVAKSDINRVSWTNNTNTDLRQPRYEVKGENRFDEDGYLNIKDIYGNIIARNAADFTIELEGGFIKTYLVTIPQ